MWSNFIGSLQKINPFELPHLFGGEPWDLICIALQRSVLISRFPCSLLLLSEKVRSLCCTLEVKKADNGRFYEISAIRGLTFGHANDVMHPWKEENTKGSKCLQRAEQSSFIKTFDLPHLPSVPPQRVSQLLTPLFRDPGVTEQQVPADLQFYSMQRWFRHNNRQLCGKTLPEKFHL